MILFESVTGAKVKDCIPGENLFFIMEEGQMGKAIGKSGANIKRMEAMIKKKIKLAEFSSNVLQFARNLIYPAEVLDIKQEDGIIIIQGKDTNARAMLIGRERQNVNHLNSVLNRYFDVKEIRVI